MLLSLVILFSAAGRASVFRASGGRAVERVEKIEKAIGDRLVEHVVIDRLQLPFDIGLHIWPGFDAAALNDLHVFGSRLCFAQGLALCMRRRSGSRRNATTHRPNRRPGGYRA